MPLLSLRKNWVVWVRLPTGLLCHVEVWLTSAENRSCKKDEEDNIRQLMLKQRTDGIAGMQTIRTDGIA